jgi:hypothetical protein
MSTKNKNSTSWHFHFLSDGSTGIQDSYTQEQIDDGFLVAKDNLSKGSTGKQFALFDSWEQFQLFEKEHEYHHYYEVIQGHKPQKLKFDFDGDNVKQAEKDFPLVLEAIRKTFKQQFGISLKDENLAICSSHGDDKRSWHIIIHGYYVANNVQAREFYNKVSLNAPQTTTKKGKPCLDPNVYSKFQCFRLQGSAKKGSTRVKDLDSISKLFSFENTLITNIDGCVPLQEIIIANVEKPATVYIKYTEDEVVDILNRLSPSRWQQHDSWIKIGMALKCELGDNGLSLWKQFSEEHYENYDEKEHDRRWRSFQKVGITIGTLIKWAIEDTARLLSWVNEWDISDSEEENIEAYDNIDSDKVGKFDASEEQDMPEYTTKEMILLTNIDNKQLSKFKEIIKPAIYSKGRYFSDVRLLMAKPVTEEEVMQFIKETCVCIINGGNSFY